MRLGTTLSLSDFQEIYLIKAVQEAPWVMPFKLTSLALSVLRSGKTDKCYKTDVEREKEET